MSDNDLSEVYGLILDGEVRYVGVSLSPHIRLYQHRMSAKNGETTPIHKAMREANNVGMTIFERGVEWGKRAGAEQTIIHRMLKDGCDLLNVRVVPEASICSDLTIDKEMIRSEFSSRPRGFSLTPQASSVVDSYPSKGRGKRISKIILQHESVEKMLNSTMANSKQYLNMLSAKYGEGRLLADVINEERVLRGEQ